MVAIEMCLFVNARGSKWLTLLSTFVEGAKTYSLGATIPPHSSAEFYLEILAPKTPLNTNPKTPLCLAGNTPPALPTLAATSS